MMNIHVIFDHLAVAPVSTLWVRVSTRLFFLFACYSVIMSTVQNDITIIYSSKTTNFKVCVF